MNIIADIEKLQQDRYAYLLVEELKKCLQGKEAFIYYKFPLYRGDLPEDLRQVQVMLISKKYGVVYFNCLDCKRKLTAEETAYMDDLYENLHGRLSRDATFRRNRRELNVGLNSVVIVPDNSNFYDDSDKEFLYVSLDRIEDLLTALEQESLNENVFSHLITTIEGTKKVIRKKNRKVIEGTNGKRTKSQVLNDIQNHEATFDIEQKKIALITIDGPQRIRGLAGSGKTIVLTMKAALYHLQNPNEDILYTYYTKSLYGLIRNLIERYYRDFSDNREPDWNKIHILHGWGGAGVNGVYYQGCMDNGVAPLKYSDAIGHGLDPFDYVCSCLLTHDLSPKYGLTLIDEGQDFPKFFYRLCYALSVNKKIVWAYDDFQNIFDVNLQNEKETFGKDADGKYFVDFEKMTNPYRDMVLHVCYRNPREALICAFSLGLGIYNEHVLQRLSDNEYWKSLGFCVEKGNSKDGSEMVISRPNENSPSTLNETFGKSISVLQCENLVDECEKVASLISDDIKKEGLNADDICVICLDDKNIGAYYSCLSEELLRKGIRCYNLLHAPYSATEFYLEGLVTLATLNKAKGNEAGMVYIMGVDKIFNDRNNVILRNRLFTAITRTKGWAVLSGEGSIGYCIDEMNKLLNEKMKLHFLQPSVESTKTIYSGSEKRSNDLMELQKKIADLISDGMSFEDIIRDIKQKA